jgi:hypothetical protein
VIPAVYKSQSCSRAEFESPCELRKLRLHPFDDAVESAFVFCIFPFFSPLLFAAGYSQHPEAQWVPLNFRAHLLAAQFLISFTSAV